VKSQEVIKAIEALAKKQVLVGIPAANNTRPGERIGNAAIGYINEFGSPAMNIPPRSFLRAGVKAALPKIAERLKAAAKAAARGDQSAVEGHLNAAGMLGADQVKRTIRAGIDPPLAESTILARQIRNQDLHYRVRARLAEDPKARRAAYEAGLISSYRRKAGKATPLYDTGALLNAIAWVLR